MHKAAIVSLGCSRNLTDSEVILGYAHKAGFRVVDVDDSPDVLIVNTCAFIDAARKESIEAIAEAVRLKTGGSVKKVVVSGCLPQMYGKHPGSLPNGVDLVIGTSDLPAIGRHIRRLFTIRRAAASEISDKLDFIYSERSPRVLMTPPHYAFVKISEGCDNHCSYCVIPRLRGRFRSRSIRSVAREMEMLSADGRLKEVNLIGQDTTLFGMDRYGRAAFPELLNRLCRLENSVRWIRILYTHPAHYSDELISVIAGQPKICKYLDLPIQHINDRLLRSMNRLSL